MKGTTPKVFRLCVCVLITKRSFELFVCFDLVRIHSQHSLHQLLLCLSSSLLPSSFVVCQSSFTRRRQFVESARVLFFLFFFRRFGEYIYLDLFYITSNLKVDQKILFALRIGQRAGKKMELSEPGSQQLEEHNMFAWANYAKLY